MKVNVRRGFNTILTESEVKEIRRRRKHGERGNDLAQQYGVSKQTICDINKGRSWKEVQP